jgi:hypothetical protein
MLHAMWRGYYTPNILNYTACHSRTVILYFKIRATRLIPIKSHINTRGEGIIRVLNKLDNSYNVIGD